MRKITRYINHTTGRLLVIKETPLGNLVGEVYDNGIEDGHWDARATFYADEGDADEFRLYKC